MLDKTEKLVLDTLIENGYTYARVDFDSIERTLLPLVNDKIKDARKKLTYEKLSSAVRYLIKKEYVEGQKFQFGQRPVPEYRQVHVTYKGENYKSFALAQFKEDMFRSLLLPIIVSLVVTAVTTFCGYIWAISKFAIQ